MFDIVTTGGGDDTAGNRMVLICGTKSGTKYRQQIDSSGGLRGTWRFPFDDCSGSNNFIRQMNLRSESQSR